MGIYEGNQNFCQMDMIPDPKDCTFGRQGRTYDPSKEAKFDPSVHLDLQLPKSISIFEGNGFKTVTDSRRGSVLINISFNIIIDKDYLIELCESYKNRGPDSKFAHSEVFKVLSEEGATEARRICLELKKYAEQDERSCKLRSDFLKLVQILDSRTDPNLTKVFCP